MLRVKDIFNRTPRTKLDYHLSNPLLNNSDVLEEGVLSVYLFIAYLSDSFTDPLAQCLKYVDYVVLRILLGKFAQYLQLFILVSTVTLLPLRDRDFPMNTR